MNRDKAIRMWDVMEEAYSARSQGYRMDYSIEWIAPFQIFGNLYYVGEKVVCMYLVDSGEGLILFDTGFPHAKEQLFKNIQLLGFKLEDILFIFHSHEHYDHFGATHDLQQLYGCKTFISKYGADVFRNHPEHTEIQSSMCPDARFYHPDVELEDGDEIRCGNTTVKCVYNPGHSAGSMSYLFDVTDGNRVLRAGICGIGGFTTLHIGRLLKYGIDLEAREQYIQSIEKLKQLKVDIALDTHPRPKGIIEKREQMLANPGSNPLIDPDEWGIMLDDYLVRYQSFLKKEAAQLSDDAENQVDPKDMIKN